MAGQDLPPREGYEPVQWRRNLPFRGIRPALALGIGLGVTIFGFYKHYKTVQERTELLREELWARHYLTPLLMAEKDRQIVRYQFHNLALEKQVLEGVDNWEWGRVSSIFGHNKGINVHILEEPARYFLPSDVLK